MVRNVAEMSFYFSYTSRALNCGGWISESVAAGVQIGRILVAGQVHCWEKRILGY